MVNQNPSNNDVWLSIMAIAAAIIYAVKHYDELENISPAARVRKILYGMAGSGLCVWLIFEVMMYFGFPVRLCLCVGGCCGYLGAEAISRIGIAFIEKYLDKKIQNDNTPLTPKNKEEK